MTKVKGSQGSQPAKFFAVYSDPENGGLVTSKEVADTVPDGLT